MKITSFKYVYLPILLIPLAGVNSSFAQSFTEPVIDPVFEATDAKAEEQEAASNVRDSVHENLDTLHEDIDTVTQQESEPIAAASKQLASSEQPESRSWLNHVKSLPGYLHSVPDRLPWIREKGLIFFGRMEVDGAYYSSGITKSDSGFRIRSMRAGLAKAFKYDLSAKAEIDLTDGDSNFSNLYVRYRHKRFGLITLGNQRVAQTMVNQTSRISRTFMEEPLPAEAFGLGRKLALGWDLNKEKGGHM